MCVISRAPAEAVHGGPGGVPAGDFVQRFLLRGRLCDRAATGVHDGAQEGEAGPARTRYCYSMRHTDKESITSYNTKRDILTVIFGCNRTTKGQL